HKLTGGRVLFTHAKAIVEAHGKEGVRRPERMVGLPRADWDTDYYITRAGMIGEQLWVTTQKGGGRSSAPSELAMWEGNRFQRAAGPDPGWYYEDVVPWLGGTLAARRGF